MRKLSAAIAVLMLVALLATPAFAHDGSFNENVGAWTPVTLGHDDGSPWKGWASVTVTNTMAAWWGDFHLEIYEPLTYNVIFPDTAAMEMLDSFGNPYVDYTYAHDGTQKLDFLFYNNPVAPGETVTFNVYTDNTADQNAWFGLTVYPTPVPEPATLALLCLGALGAAYRKRS